MPFLFVDGHGGDDDDALEKPLNELVHAEHDQQVRRQAQQQHPAEQAGDAGAPAK